MKIAFVLNLKYAVPISSAYKINILRFFSRHYDLTILTNGIEFLQKQDIEAHYIKIPYYKFPSISYNLLNDLIINMKLNAIKYDLLVIWYDSLLIFNSKKPVFRFVDLCPYQNVGYAKEGDNIRIDRKIFIKILIYSFNQSSFILTNSPQLKEWLVEYNIPQHKIEWLPMGVDLERFCFKKQQEEYTLINTGEFLSIRGSDMIIQSIKILSHIDNKIRILSIGNKDEAINKWNTIFKKMGIENNIELYGMVDNNKIPEFLSKAKIGVSILENNEYYSRSPPQKIFEYMAMGLPTIANDIPTHTEFIKNGYNGFIVESAEEMAEIILILINDKEFYDRISTNARESAKKYSLKKIEYNLKEYLDNIHNL